MKSKTVLHISASPRGDLSYSRDLGTQLAYQIGAQSIGTHIVHFDIGQYFPGVPSAQFAAENLLPPEDREQNTASDWMIDDLENAGVLIISLPLHNFSIPVTLKAWVDQVVRPGRTFERGEKGKRGLLANKPVYLIITSGGPVGGEFGQQEFATAYLKYVLPTIGLSDIKCLFLDSMLRNPAHTELQMAAGRSWISEQAAEHGVTF